jgi:Haem-binding domain
MRKLKPVVLVLTLALAGAQFVQPERINPPSEPAASFEAVIQPPPDAVGVLARSCRDCHSQQTVWPWYSAVAPASWLVARDVKEGRAHLNLSQWNIYGPEASRLRMRAICEEAAQGNMPPKYYTPLHPRARLTDSDVTALCGLAKLRTW